MFAQSAPWEGAVSQFFVTIGIVTSTVFAYLSARRTKETGRQLQTNHGKRPGEYLEMVGDISNEQAFIHARLNSLVKELADHTEADAKNFSELKEALDSIKEAGR